MILKPYFLRNKIQQHSSTNFLSWTGDCNLLNSKILENDCGWILFLKKNTALHEQFFFNISRKILWKFWCDFIKISDSCSVLGTVGVPDFDISANPISTTGADEVHHITTSPLPLDVHTFLGPWVNCDVRMRGSKLHIS